MHCLGVEAEPQGADVVDCIAAVGKANQVGVGEGEGFTVNLPVPGDAGDTCVKMLFEEVISPAVRKFQPDLLVVSAGGWVEH